jgi:hypothetical protein
LVNTINQEFKTAQADIKTLKGKKWCLRHDSSKSKPAPPAKYMNQMCYILFL